MRATDTVSNNDTSPAIRTSRILLYTKSAVDRRQLDIVANVVDWKLDQITPAVECNMNPSQPNPSWSSNDRLSRVSLSSEEVEWVTSASQSFASSDAINSAVDSSARHSLGKKRTDELERRLSPRGPTGSSLISAAAQASRLRKESSFNYRTPVSKGTSGIWPSPIQQGKPPLEREDSEIRFVNGTRVVTSSGSLNSSSLTGTHIRAALAGEASGLFDAKERDQPLFGSLKKIDEISKVIEIMPISSCGVHVARIIGEVGVSPFGNDNMANITSKRISTSLGIAYSAPWGMLRSQNSQQRSGDVIVVSPPRSGQTPILKALDMMLHSRAVSDFSEAAFMNRVGWVESTLPSAPAIERRLFKSYLPLEFFMKQAADPDLNVKIVVVLRDPVALRDSWFRHCKAVFQHFHPKIPFNFSVEEFTLQMTLSQGRNLGDIRNSTVDKLPDEHVKFCEKFVASVLKCINWSNVHIIFYEDFVSHPAQVLKRLEEFVFSTSNHTSRMTTKAIAAILTAGRKGKQPPPDMPQSVLAKLQNQWDFEIATKGPWHFDSYRAMRKQFGLRRSDDDDNRATRLRSRLSLRPKFRTGVSRPLKSSDDENRPARSSILKVFTAIFEKRMSNMN